MSTPPPREQAYTALSRGRHGTDLYIQVEDRRVEERHAAETERDPLDDLRQAIRNSAAKQMALDQIEQPPPASSLDQLRHERDTLRRRLGTGPRDPSPDYSRLSDAQAREQHYRQGAQWRLDTARKELNDLGTIGWRARCTHRRELERRIARFESDVVRHKAELAGLEAQLQQLAPSMQARMDWEREHRTDLDRVATLDRQIYMTELFERVASRGVERDRGVSLGIEL